MSRNISYQCDVCGQDLKGPDARTVASECALLKLWVPTEPRSGGGQRYDLCLDCFAGLISFLETGRPKEEGE